MNRSAVPAVAAGVGAVAALVASLYLYAKNKKNGTSQRPRVLVTGFNDWRGLKSSSDVWKSDENPSSRLILGNSCDKPPLLRQGELPKTLAKMDIGVDFSFVTLPTLWATSYAVDYLYFDVVIHLGLGVYDCFDTILVESGAFNGRRSAADARGALPSSHLISGNYLGNLHPSIHQKRTADSAVKQPLPCGFTAKLAPAREANTYICNETHWRALEAVQTASTSSGTGRLLGGYFLHVPYPKETDDYGPLATAVGELVARLVRGTLSP